MTTSTRASWGQSATTALDEPLDPWASTEEPKGAGAFDLLDQALELLLKVDAEVDPDTVAGAQASLLLERYVKLERAVAAGRLAFARRAAECMNWRAEGHRSAADWFAQKTETSVGEAIATLETARRLPELPATREALCQGSLSVAQVREIVPAASADPSAEAELIEAAGYLSLKGLQNRARAVKAAAATDDAARAANIYRSRFLRHWVDPEGAFHLRARLTPDAGAEVLSVVRARAAFVADEATQAGVPPEPSEAYDADALVALVTGDLRMATFSGNVGGRTRSAVVYLHVSLEALHRGLLEAGELCEVPGIGPVPLVVVEHLMGDALAKLVIEKGVDVTTVFNLGRTVPAAVATALEARDRVCVVPGCDVSLSLEIDHWKIPYGKRGPTVLWNLARLCKFHHNLKTYQGWQLRGGPGKWEWVAPGAGP
jgi:hypothetical protein